MNLENHFCQTEEILGVKWCITSKILNYNTIFLLMEEYVANKLANHDFRPVIFILQHDHVYTAGRSAKAQDILSMNHDIPIISTNRGGQYTYHGPGQLIVYPILFLQNRDLRAYIRVLEGWIQDILRHFKIETHTDSERVGVWTYNGFNEYKIAAIGVKVKKWMTYHGFAMNICNDLSYYKSIVPCGISKHGITNMEEILSFDRKNTNNTSTNLLEDVIEQVIRYMPVYDRL